MRLIQAGRRDNRCRVNVGVLVLEFELGLQSGTTSVILLVLDFDVVQRICRVKLERAGGSRASQRKPLVNDEAVVDPNTDALVQICAGGGHGSREGIGRGRGRREEAEVAYAKIVV